jgi:hypothetical protein
MISEVAVIAVAGQMDRGAQPLRNCSLASDVLTRSPQATRQHSLGSANTGDFLDALR